MKRFETELEKRWRENTIIFNVVFKKILNLHTISNSVTRDICIFFLFINYLFIIIKKNTYSPRAPFIESTYWLRAIHRNFSYFYLERVQNGCQSCNAFNKTIKSWQRGDSRGRVAITTQSAAKIVQLKVYNVQASLTLRGGSFSNAIITCYYFHLLAIRELWR